MNDEMKEKLKKMSIEELQQYRGAAKGINRIINIIGVGIILFILNFISILTIIPGAIFLFIISHTSIEINKTIIEIDNHILKLSDK